jgi:hypothetical protein
MTSTSKTLFNSISIVTFLLFSLISFSQDKLSSDEGNVLFDGYDPVSYRLGEPQKGVSKYSIKVDGRIIQFVSKENMDRFEGNFERYMPEYGGWCAIAMADGSFVVPDYSLYKIQDDRLLFFSVRAFFNGLTAWEKDSEGNLIKADNNYYVKYFPGGE